MNVLNNLCDTKTTLLIDGDIYLYQACSSCEEEVDWGDDIWSLTTDLAAAKRMFASRIKEFQERLGSDEILVCLTEGSNFR